MKREEFRVGRFVFWVLSLVVLVGCSKVNRKIRSYTNEKTHTYSYNTFTKINRAWFSDDEKLLNLRDSTGVTKVFDMETLTLSSKTLSDNLNNKKKDEKKNSFTYYEDDKIYVESSMGSKVGDPSFSFSIGHKARLDKGNQAKLNQELSDMANLSSQYFDKNKTSKVSSRDKKNEPSVPNSNLTKKLKASINQDGSVSIYSRGTTKKLVTIKLFKNNHRGESVTILGKKYENSNPDSWLAITPEGYYVGSSDAYRYFDVEKNYEKFYRPDIVRMALQGKSIEENLPTIADIKAPPKIEIIDTKQNQENLKLVVKITPQSGGVGDIRLYHNGTAIELQTKDFTSQQPKKPFLKNFQLNLEEGENEIQVIAFEQSNSQRSEYATYHVTLTSTHQYRPKLYALVVGIQEFENSKKNLTYTRSDAKLFAQTLAKVRQGLFDQGKIITLLSKEETTKEHILEAFEQFKGIDNRDMFLFYAGSHGMVDGDIYYLISSNVGSLSSRRLQKDAISRDEIKIAISNIPASKKMIILDTCFAGQYSEESDNKRVATRGLSEEEALNVLSRAVGTNVFSASKSTQESLEGYKEHGLFTYVLVEGLREEADQNHDGYIKTFELADYVDEVVPRISDRKFKHKQFPTINTSGQAFPIGRVQQ